MIVTAVILYAGLGLAIARVDLSNKKGPEKLGKVCLIHSAEPAMVEVQTASAATPDAVYTVGSIRLDSALMDDAWVRAMDLMRASGEDVDKMMVNAIDTVDRWRDTPYDENQFTTFDADET